MVCPYCGQEMEHGEATYLPMQGLDMMSLNYMADGEREKKRRHRQRHSVILYGGTDVEAFYCQTCKLILPLMQGK